MARSNTVMHTWTYGVKVAVAGGDHVVSVRDLPEVVTSGDDFEEALRLAADAIAVVVTGRMADEEPCQPPPRCARENTRSFCRHGSPPRRRCIKPGRTRVSAKPNWAGGSVVRRPRYVVFSTRVTGRSSTNLTKPPAPWARR